MNKKRYIILAVIVLVMLVWFFRGTDERIENDATLTVTVVQPLSTVIDERINVTGVTVPRESVVVISELSNVRIVEVLADVGDRVKKDQLLARLDDASLNNQVQQLQSEYNRVHDEFKRVDAIRDTGYISKEMLVQKRTLMEAALAKLDDAKLDLSRAQVRAPADGIIFERNASIGALVNVNEPLYRIAYLGEIEIEAQVPEAQLSKLKLDQDCEVFLSGQTAGIPGKIRLITPQISNTSRTASIRVALNQAQTLPIGLFSQIEINLHEVSGSLLPATALQQDTQGFYVWMLDKDNKTVRLPVVIKLRSSDGIVFENLPSDARIIARAGVFLKEGEKVHVVEQP